MLAEALESVLAQTYRDFEVWVVDDGSGTAKAVCDKLGPKFDARDVNLVHANLSENSGYQCAPKNHGVQLCHGAYIAYLDDDNLWDPDHLEVLMEVMERGQADIVYSSWRYEKDGQIQHTSFTQASPQALVGLTSGPELNFIDTSAILHAKAPLRYAFGGEVWNENLTRFGDWELMKRCVERKLRFEAVDKETFTYRWHDSNIQLTRPANFLSTKMNATVGRKSWHGRDAVGA